MAIAVVDDRDGYVLLSRDDDLYAVVERRAGRFYPLHGGCRPGVPCDPEAVPRIVGEHEWTDEIKARAVLCFAVRRYRQLAEHLW